MTDSTRENASMTPEQQAVIEAAKAHDWTPSDTARLTDLRAAVQALRRAEAARRPQPVDELPARPEPGE